MKDELEKIIEGAIYGDTDLVQSALKKGVFPDTEYRGWTALRWAIQENHYDIVEILIKSGADIENRDQQERFSILDTAVGECRIEIVKLLLKNGVDINGETANGSVLHTAVAYDMIDLVELLSNNGADLSTKDSDGFNPVEFAIKYSDKKTIKKLKETLHNKK